MSIILKKVQRTNLRGEEKTVRWHPVQRATQRVGEDEVAELIADETTLNPMEALMAIRQLRKVVSRLLLDGKSVELGNWGSFYLTLGTTGESSPEALSVKNVEQVRINFHAGKALKAELQKASFVWLDDLVGG